MKADARIVLVDRTAGSLPGRHGLAVLRAALEARGASVASVHAPHQAAGGSFVVAGRVDDPQVRGLLAAAGVEAPAAPESLACVRSGGALVLAGADDRGLMYALLEAADRVRTRGAQALDAMEGLADRPEHAVRSFCRFLMGKLDDEWYGSLDFWRYYYGRLAASRYNRFTLILGFDTGYLTPPYPFYVDVPEFPKVRVKTLSAAELAARLEHLRVIIRLAHEHGIEFFLGTWQQTPWVGDEERLVENLPADEKELARYCVCGLKALLRATPELDGIHFRVNHEAGVGTQESNEEFWRSLVTAAGEVRTDLKLDLRAKGLTDDMIRDGQATGMRITVPTKYWCEHAALPHHLTQMRQEELTQLSNFNHSRRYSYADMLKRPRSYETLYRLWNNGTTSVLLWGDPDYARRFSASCHLGDAAGFEITDPLALRWGHSTLQKDAWRLHKDRKYAPGRWEDERYWMTYLVFGRLGYSTSTPSEVWERELSARFPATAAPAVLDAYAAAGKILPLITAFHMPVHPQLAYWPEVSSGAALFEEHNHQPYKYMGKPMSYLTSEPSDPGLFYGVAEYAVDAAAGKQRPKYTPLQVAEWLAALAAAVRAALATAAAVRGIDKSAEWAGTQLDFLMLADMAEFHAHKARAAVALALKQHAAAHASMVKARDAWRSLAERGGAYHDNLVFQAGHNTGGRMGHWRDWLPEIDKDVAKLASLAGSAAAPAASVALSRPLRDIASAVPLVPETAPAGRDLDLRLAVDSLDSLGTPWTLFYRHANQLEGPFRSAGMERCDGGFSAVIPASYVTAEWDLLVYFGCTIDGQAVLSPGVWNALYPMPYLVVRMEE
jgi:hypothetical protein